MIMGWCGGVMVVVFVVFSENFELIGNGGFMLRFNVGGSCKIWFGGFIGVLERRFCGKDREFCNTGSSLSFVDAVLAPRVLPCRNQAWTS